MTATHEHIVVLTEATLPYGRGKGSKTSKILTDGTRFYCAGDPDAGTPCPQNYTAESFSSVMSHRSGRHGAVKAANRANGRDVAATLRHMKGRASALLTEIQKVEAQLTSSEPEVVTPVHDGMVKAEWKDRAQKAERELAQIRRTIGRLAG